jgi:choline-sulfatase
VFLGKTDVYNHSSTLGFSEAILPGDRKPPGDQNIARNPLAIRQGADGRANGFGVKEYPFGGDQRRIEAALEWITSKAPDMDRPWVLDANISNPHFPHFVTQKLWDKYPKGENLPDHGADCESAKHPYALDLRAHFQTDKFTKPQIRRLRRGYLGCITYVDQELGRLLDALEETGLMENTVIAYSSDHGEMLGKFGMWWKCSLYEDSVRVPLLVAGPGFQPGTRVNTPVDLLDLQATIFKAVGGEKPSGWTGTPLQDIPADDPDRAVFSEYHGHGTRASAYMIRRGKWKLIHYCSAPDQLFDLEIDPDELNNLAGEYPDTLEELREELERICSPEAENIRAEQFIQKQLKAIGGAGHVEGKGAYLDS